MLELVDEVIFNAGIKGYTELLVTPFRAGKIFKMTFFLIGELGICKEDYE
ncbi:carbamoyl-phosphate synthase domain-containing protein [Halobacteriota archaeon]